MSSKRRTYEEVKQIIEESGFEWVEERDEIEDGKQTQTITTYIGAAGVLVVKRSIEPNNFPSRVSFTMNDRNTFLSISVSR